MSGKCWQFVILIFMVWTSAVHAEAQYETNGVTADTVGMEMRSSDVILRINSNPFGGWDLNTFGVVLMPTEVTGPETELLERWKIKQSKRWNILPQGRFEINASAYTAAADECGKSDGITASGLKVTNNRTLACPDSFPFGAKILIEGLGVFRCEDRGGAIKGNRFDIYMTTKSDALAFGRKKLFAEVEFD